MKICPKCLSSHHKTGKFCSRKCANSRTFSKESKEKKSKSNKDWWNSLSSNDRDEIGSQKKKNLPVRSPGYKPSEKWYSAHKEKTEKYYNEYITRWKLGEVSGMHGIKNKEISSLVRRYIFKKYDNKCSKCGWSEVHPITGKIPLQINHIDGHHEHTVESNLELLCPNCHSLTVTYGSLNKGNGRRYYKNRYYSGSFKGQYYGKREELYV